MMVYFSLCAYKTHRYLPLLVRAHFKHSRSSSQVLHFNWPNPPCKEDIAEFCYDVNYAKNSTVPAPSSTGSPPTAEGSSGFLPMFGSVGPGAGRPKSDASKAMITLFLRFGILVLTLDFFLICGKASLQCTRKTNIKIQFIFMTPFVVDIQLQSDMVQVKMECWLLKRFSFAIQIGAQFIESMKHV